MDTVRSDQLFEYLDARRDARIQFQTTFQSHFVRLDAVNVFHFWRLHFCFAFLFCFLTSFLTSFYLKTKTRTRNQTEKKNRKVLRGVDVVDAATSILILAP